MEDALLATVVAANAFIARARPLGETLTDIARLGCQALETDMAGLTLTRNGGPRTVAYTHNVVPEIDGAQYESDRGPCLDASRTGTIVHMRATDRDGRWPEFARAADRHGIHSSMSVPILVGDDSIGALNFYDRRPAHFDEAMTEAALGFAGQTAIVAAYLDKADLADHMQQAMESRATIDQAKGVIIATAGCTPEQAFEILRRQSQAENRKLRDIAAEIVSRQIRDRQ